MEVVALILGTYALTSSVMYSDGPYSVLYRIRNNEAIKDFGVLECFMCASIWVSIILTFILGLEWLYCLIAWGAAIIIDKILTWLFTK